ncbi:MAG: NADH:ubiquinone oxidoreductase subunit K [Halobacteriales archaeon]|jgi:NADH:ubiquinone oxidoreductase subunit K
MNPSTIAFGVALVVLAIGLIGTVVGRNVVKTIIGIELMSKAALLNFVAGGYEGGQAIVVLLVVIDAIVVAVMMGMTVAVYRHYGTLDVEHLGRLTW